MADMNDLYRSIEQIVVEDLAEFEKELKEQANVRIGMNGLPISNLAEEVEIVGMDGLPILKEFTENSVEEVLKGCLKELQRMLGVLKPLVQGFGSPELSTMDKQHITKAITEIDAAHTSVNNAAQFVRTMKPSVRQREGIL